MALGHELRLGLGVLDLEDVQLDLLARQLLEVAADALGLGAAATDDDAGAGGVDVHADPVTGALELDAGDAGTVEGLEQHLSDAHVLGDEVAVPLPLLRAVREPV
jgi:hypothetical protein